MISKRSLDQMMDLIKDEMNKAYQTDEDSESVDAKSGLGPPLKPIDTTKRMALSRRIGEIIEQAKSIEAVVRLVLSPSTILSAIPPREEEETTTTTTKSIS